MEYAKGLQNEVILKKWDALAKGKRENPTVRLCFCAYDHEVVEARLQCEGNAAREIEATLLRSLVGRELFDDDTPISPTYDIAWDTWVNPFGIMPQFTVADGKHALGYHIDPVVKDLSEDMEKLRGGNFGVNRERTKQKIEVAEDVLGDILPIRMVQESLVGQITNPLVARMGMENYYLAMYDTPDELHEVMEMATTLYEKYYDFLEQEKLLVPTCGISPIHQESFAFNNELPTDHVEKTTQVWGFLESQETTAVSPETFGEFVFPYQDRLTSISIRSYNSPEI